VQRHCANYLNRAISATAAWGLKGPHMIRLRLSPDMIRAAGTDRFLPRQLHAMPRGAA
jgi:hypothetical protein